MSKGPVRMENQSVAIPPDSCLLYRLLPTGDI
jgi:hypothetical protein